MLFPLPSSSYPQPLLVPEGSQYAKMGMTSSSTTTTADGPLIRDDMLAELHSGAVSSFRAGHVVALRERQPQEELYDVFFALSRGRRRNGRSTSAAGGIFQMNVHFTWALEWQQGSEASPRALPLFRTRRKGGSHQVRHNNHNTLRKKWKRQPAVEAGETLSCPFLKCLHPRCCHSQCY